MIKIVDALKDEGGAIFRSWHLVLAKHRESGQWMAKRRPAWKGEKLVGDGDPKSIAHQVMLLAEEVSGG